jgi:hypothetical protein
MGSGWNAYRSICAQYYIGRIPKLHHVYLGPSHPSPAKQVSNDRKAIPVEPSFADAIAVIACAAGLPEDGGMDDLAATGRQAFGQSTGADPAAGSAEPLFCIHHASGGLTAKTLQTTRAT